jgi:hypothetical protein
MSSTLLGNGPSMFGPHGSWLFAQFSSQSFAGLRLSLEDVLSGGIRPVVMTVLGGWKLPGIASQRGQDRYTRTQMRSEMAGPC